MSAVDTYNEKFLVVNDLDNQLTRLNGVKTFLETRITATDADITTKNSEKTTADADLTTAQGNLPTDVPGYQTKFLDCQRIDDELADLTETKGNNEAELTTVDNQITSVTASKVTADAELVTAEAAL